MNGSSCPGTFHPSIATVSTISIRYSIAEDELRCVIENNEILMQNVLQ